jgi:FkbM family methyltransferase
MISKIINKIEKWLYGRLALQPIFESFHRIGIRGMNYMQSQLVTKTGEIESMKYALKNHKPEDSKILFDVGANEGQFAIEMAKVFNKDFLIYSFEPSCKAFEKLHENVIPYPIKCFNQGFGNEHKKLFLYNSGNLFGTTYPLEPENSPGELITLTTLDDFCQENQIENIHYLKIDVEGGELDVLKGCKNMLDKRAIKYIQFEYGPNCIEARVWLRDFFLLLSNYNFFRIVTDGLRYIEKYDELLEIPLTGNFLAKIK